MDDFCPNLPSIEAFHYSSVTASNCYGNLNSLTHCFSYSSPGAYLGDRQLGLNAAILGSSEYKGPTGNPVTAVEGPVYPSQIGATFPSFGAHTNDAEDAFSDAGASYRVSVQHPAVLDLSPNVSNKNSHYEDTVTSYNFSENELNRPQPKPSSYPVYNGTDGYSKNTYPNPIPSSFNEVYELPSLVMASMASSNSYYEASNNYSLPSMNLGIDYSNLALPQAKRMFIPKISDTDSRSRTTSLHPERLKDKFWTESISNSDYCDGYGYSVDLPTLKDIEKPDRVLIDTKDFLFADRNKVFGEKNGSSPGFSNAEETVALVDLRNSNGGGTNAEKQKPVKKSERIRKSMKLDTVEPGIPDAKFRKPKKKRKVSCKICSAQFSEYNNLKIHFYTHTGERPFNCSQCEKSFTKSSLLAVHELKHTGEKPHQCPTCEQRFRLTSTLKSHILTHTGERPFQCDLCGASFTQRAALKRHKATHESEQVQLFTCHLCDKSFRDKFYIKKHLLSHESKTKHACSECGEGFSSNKKLQIHVMKHNEGPVPFKCNKCPSAFKTQKSLRQHKKRMHERGEELRCDDCDATFNRKDSFRSHRKVHMGDQLVNCRICDASFNNNVTLKKHMKRHPPETIASNSSSNSCQSLYCNRCTKKCLTKRQLQTHKCVLSSGTETILAETTSQECKSNIPVLSLNDRSGVTVQSEASTSDRTDLTNQAETSTSDRIVSTNQSVASITYRTVSTNHSEASTSDRTSVTNQSEASTYDSSIDKCLNYDCKLENNGTLKGPSNQLNERALQESRVVNILAAVLEVAD